MDPRKSVLTGPIVDLPAQGLLDLFHSATRDNSTKKAVIFQDKNLTYSELDLASNRIAHLILRLCGTSAKNQAVLICSKPTENLPMILLGILKAGMSYLPIDDEFPLERKRYILEDAKPFLAILDKDVDTSLFAGHCQFKTVEELLDASKLEPDSHLNVSRDHLSVPLILYTSGSTGVPKGVRLSDGALLNRLQWQWRKLPYRPEEKVCIAKTALTFVDSVSEIWSPLLSGLTLVVVPKETSKDPEKLLTILQRYEIGRLVLVPSLLKSLLMFVKLKSLEYPLGSLKLWVCSGETLLASVVGDFFKCFAGQGKCLANFYGSTEVMGDVTYHLFNETMVIPKDRVPIGLPMDNCVAYVVDDKLKLVDKGEVGELLIAGSNLAQGYIRDFNEKKFIQDPFSKGKAFRTGDYARIVNGLLFYEGRHDSQVKIRGHRIDLSEVEKAALKVPQVRDAVVLCDTDHDSQNVLLCFVVLRDKSKVEDVQSHLRDSLPSYMVPRIVATEHIPLLINGKTDRQELLRRFKSSQMNGNGPCIYCDVPDHLLDKAKVLFPIVAEVIGDGKRVELNSNFYELGGNSLNSVYTVVKLHEHGYSLSIGEFIHAKNMKEILEKLKVGTDSGGLAEEEDDHKKYQLEMLNDNHKKDVLEMITGSFLNKADLEQLLAPDIKREDYAELMNEIWEPLVEKNFSFVLKSRETGEVLSVALNFDARDEPPVVIESKLAIIFEFLEHVESPVLREKLPPGIGSVFHTFMMATHEKLDSAENVVLMRLMEKHCLKIAKERKFKGILTTNTSPLTQQLGTDVFKYQVMEDYQVNRYVAPDGTRPFHKALDNQRAVCSWKRVDD